MSKSGFVSFREFERVESPGIFTGKKGSGNETESAKTDILLLFFFCTSRER
jgi:hypothetical protein